jgi:hypothetical protein
MQFWNECKAIVIQHKKAIVLALSLTLMFALYFIIWHYTSLRITGSYTVINVSAPFLRMAAYYLILSVFFSSLICTFLIIVKRRLIKKIFIVVILFIFFGSEIIRIFDWGALYFGGNHIDSNFWAHAFYADGFVFLTTKVAAFLYVATAVFFASLYYILHQLSVVTSSE